MEETFEILVPEFREHTLQEGPSHFVIESRCKLYRAMLPNAHRLIYESFKAGRSVRDVAFSVRTQDGNFIGFRAIFQSIDALCLTKILLNWERFEPYLDQMRSSYQWQESQIKKDFFVWPLRFRWSLSCPSASLSLIFSSIVMGGALYLFSKTTIEEIPTSVSIKASGARVVGLFLVLSSFMLSFKTIVYAFLNNLATGRYNEFKVRVNFLGIYLDRTKGPNMDSSNHGKLTHFAHIFSLMSASSLLLSLPYWAQKLSMDANTYHHLLQLLPVIVLIELSPFSKSVVTDALLLIYNYWDHEMKSGGRSKRTHWNDLRDKIVSRMHQGFVALWVLVLVGYFVFIFPFFLKNVFLLLEWPSWVQAFPAVMSLLMLMAGGLFVLSEFSNGFGYTGPTRSFRRFWLVWDQRRHLSRLAHTKSPLEILKGFPLFAGLRSEVQVKIAQRSSMITLHRGTYICSRGEKRRDLYLILYGSVGVFLQGELGSLKKLLELKSGSILGEIGFLAGQRRTADVITLEETILLRIRYSKETENLMVSQDRLSYLRDRIWLLQTLASTELFQKIPFEALQLILQLGKIVDHPKGVTVTRQGDVGHSFYMVIQGELRVTIDGVVRTNLSRGDVFGEIALLFGTQRTATVVTLDCTKLLEISDQEFWYLLSNHFALGLYLERTALRRLHQDFLLPEHEAKNAG